MQFSPVEGGFLKLTSIIEDAEEITIPESHMDEKGVERPIIEIDVNLRDFLRVSKLKRVKFAANSKVKRITSFIDFPVLQEFDFPSSVEVISKNAISQLDLRYINFPPDSKLRDLGPGNFAFSRITSLALPSSVGCIHRGQLNAMPHLNSLTFMGESKHYVTNDGIVYLRHPLSVVFVPRYRRRVFLRRGIEHVLPDSISENAQIKKLFFPASVKQLHTNCLIGSKILSIKFASNSQLKTISKRSLNNLRNIKKLIIPPNVEAIDQEAIYCCVLLSHIVFHPKCQLKYFRYSDNHLKKLVFHASIHNFDVSLPRCNVTFHSSPRRFVVDDIGIIYSRYPFGVKFIPYEIKHLTIRRGVEILHPFSLYERSNRQNNLLIPSSVKEISRAFVGSRMINLKINVNSKLKELGGFYLCKRLEKIVVPSSIEILKSKAFYKCMSLKSLRFPKNSHLKEISEFAFHDSMSGDFNIPKSVENMEPYAFSLSKLKSASFQKSSILKTIPAFAFFRCIHLSLVKLPDSVEEIGPNSFKDCIKLESVQLPKNLVLVETSAFSGCVRLVSIYFPASLKIIEEFAFNQCNFKQIAFGHDSKLEFVAKNAFSVNFDEIEIDCSPRIFESLSLSKSLLMINDKKECS